MLKLNENNKINIPFYLKLSIFTNLNKYLNLRV